MPGQVGSATAPGQQRISVSTSPLDVDTAKLALDGAGSYVSDELRIIALSGLSINIDRTGILAGNNITVAVQIRVGGQNDAWRTLGIPCCCDPDTLTNIAITTATFVSWDHIAARQARFVVTGVADDAAVGSITLMAAAS